MFMLMNSYIMIDLFLILRNPFYPRKKRNRWYVLFGFIVFLFIGFITCYMILFKRNTIKLFDYDDQIHYIFILQAYIFIIIIIFTIIPQVLVILRLCSEGTSQDLRKLIMHRYILYTLFYILFVSNPVLIVFKNLLSKTFMMKYEWTLMLYVIAGIPIAFIRISEPFVWSIFKKSFYQRCRSRQIVEKMKTKKFSQESLDTFINSAMNIEFVYLILLGIN